MEKTTKQQHLESGAVPPNLLLFFNKRRACCECEPNRDRKKGYTNSKHANNSGKQHNLFSVWRTIPEFLLASSLK